MNSIKLLFVLLTSALLLLETNDAIGQCTVDLGPATLNVCQDVGFAVLVPNVTNTSGPLTYDWSNGSNDIVDTVLAPGNYLVTVTDNNGSCVDSISISFVTTSPPCAPAYTVNGLVENANGDPVRLSDVYLLDRSRLSTSGYDTVDVTTTDNLGAYSFGFSSYPSVPLTILVKPDSLLYPTLLPTYLGDTAFWGGAQNFVLDTIGLTVDPIVCSEVNTSVFTPGTNVIIGKVESNIPGKAAQPIEDEDIIITRTPPGVPVAYKPTDIQGRFDIGGLDQATFAIIADVAGIPMNTTTNTIDFSGKSNDTVYVTIVVDSNVVTLEVDGANAIITRDAIAGFDLYPNPSTGEIYIKLSDNYGLLDITVANVLGQEVYNRQHTSAPIIPIKIDSEPGLYIVTLRNADGHLATQKMILE